MGKTLRNHAHPWRFYVFTPRLLVIYVLARWVAPVASRVRWWFEDGGSIENVDRGWRVISSKIDMEPLEEVGRYLGCEPVTTHGIGLSTEHHPFAHVDDHTIQDPSNRPAAAPSNLVCCYCDLRILPVLISKVCKPCPPKGQTRLLVLLHVVPQFRGTTFRRARLIAPGLGLR